MTRYNRFPRRQALAALSLVLCIVPHVRAVTFSTAVDARANLFGSGHAVAPPNDGTQGLLPPFVSFSASADSVVTFSSVLGLVGPNKDVPQDVHDASGEPYDNASTDLNSVGGISGISDSLTMALLGVFLSDAEPQDPAPPRLSFGTNHSFTDLSPLLNQSFYIGLGTGKRFHVPAGATRLFLGFGKGDFFRGNPSQYSNDIGRLATVFSVSDASLPGDANGDGLVGFPDLLVLAQNYGMKSAASVVQGDFNNDGSVNFTDLLLLVQHFSPGATAAATSVPEPAAAIAIPAAILLLVRRRSR